MSITEDRPATGQDTEALEGDKLDQAFDKVRHTEVGRSIFRSPRRVTPRDRAAGHWSSFLLHIYPVKVRKRELGFKYSWYLGVISTVLLGSLVASGVYLMFFYVPSPANAYTNIQTIQTEVPFGQYVRNVHRWSAHLMVLAVAAHMAKVFYRGAYKQPRQFNWVIGVVLLVLTLLMSFTGYLLPWDQLAFWAVTVGTEMAGYVPFIGEQVKEVLLGGPTVDSSTLLRFYVLHVAVLPSLIIFTLMIHLWRWRKDAMFDQEALDADDSTDESTDGETGETDAPVATADDAAAMAVAARTALVQPQAVPVELSRAPAEVDGKRVLGVVPGKPVAGERKIDDPDDKVMVWPHLLVRHGVAAMAALLVVMIIAVLFDAPLRAIANPQVTPNPEKAPWYFAALQELLAIFHPLVAGVLVPGAIIIGLVALPYIDNSRFIKARHRKVAVATFTTFLVIWIILTLIGFMFRGPNWGWVWPWQEWHGEL